MRVGGGGGDSVCERAHACERSRCMCAILTPTNRGTSILKTPDSGTVAY